MSIPYSLLLEGADEKDIASALIVQMQSERHAIMHAQGEELVELYEYYIECFSTGRETIRLLAVALVEGLEAITPIEVRQAGLSYLSSTITPDKAKDIIRRELSYQLIIQSSVKEFIELAGSLLTKKNPVPKATSSTVDIIVGNERPQESTDIPESA